MTTDQNNHPATTPAAVNPTTSITFLISGEAEQDNSGAVCKVRVKARQRDGSVALHRMVAIPGQHAVQVDVQDGNGKTLQLVLHPESARALLESQQPDAPPVGARDPGSAWSATVPASGEVLVPTQARWQLPAGPADASGGMGQRGLLSDLVGGLAFTVLKLIGLDPVGVAANTGAQAVAKFIDDQVTEGVYRLSRTRPASLKNKPTTTLDSTPTVQLVLIHGTAVNTASTFGDWWDHNPDVINSVFDAYHDQVYALDHDTLGKSPIFNALTLARALPADARLHLLTHSRGGLVAEVLVRACAGITKADLDFFADTAGCDYQHHRDELEELGNLLKNNNIRILRVVRVACPAHGTYLASGRLDAYFSVLAYLLDSTVGPLAGAMVKFLQAMASRRMDPTTLPGLEAMMPGRALTRWINSPCTPVAGDLRVLAGDAEPTLLNHWIRALMAYALHPLFLGDNDLVVNTNSMYGGAVRLGGASFVLDRSADTAHFFYFKNTRTAHHARNALQTVELPPEFAPIGPLSAAGKDSDGLRALPVQRATPPDDGKRPAVIVLPGILGSNLLSAAKQREWYEFWRVFGLIDRIQWGENGNGITQDGPLESYYGDLIDHLRQHHHAVPFGYDWRAPLEDSARHLAALLTTLLEQRGANGAPVHLLAHSMGAIVVRVMMLNHPAVWNRWLQSETSRFVMLGAPNGGSWAPMSLYTGDDPFGRLLASLNGWFNDQATRQKITGFEGLLQLAAGLNDEKYPLSKIQTWQDLAAKDLAAFKAGPWHDILNDSAPKSFYQWAIPTQNALARAAKLRALLDGQALVLGVAATRMALVLGESRSTPCGLLVSTQNGVDYEYTHDGDGRVTWASACLPGVRSWKISVAHGDLPKARQHFDAYVQLLDGVATPDLPEYLPPATRGQAAPAAVPWRGRLRDTALPLRVDETSLLAAALGGEDARDTTIPQAPLHVTVKHGDLKFIKEPLLLGHSSSLTLTGSEAAVDHIMGKALSRALGAGLYPDRVGEHHIFLNTQDDPSNPWGMKRPPAVIVVGLGSESELGSGQLRKAVRQGVLAYACHAAQSAAEKGQTLVPHFKLAITSIGSGTALTVGEAVCAVVQGVIDANQIMHQLGDVPKWPLVAELFVIELYLSRAAEAWQALNSAKTSGTLHISLPLGVACGKGGNRRPGGSGYRGASYDLVRVTLDDANGDPAHRAEAAMDTLEFTLFTARARSEVHRQPIQRALVNQLIAMAEGEPLRDPALTRSLHLLLLPPELRAKLGNAGNLVLELDEHTARFPWELLDDSTPDQAQGERQQALGWRDSGALVRRLRVTDYRRAPVDNLSTKALVIGLSRLPTLEGRTLDPLPNVITEVQAVATTLRIIDLNVVTVLDQPFHKCVTTLVPNAWKVVHLSGHGATLRNGLTGMLIADADVLGPAEFGAMSIVPELVFVNCCHLGLIEPGSPTQSHGEFAASVAEQLIRDGVRCVVAAGWAVSDDAASAFAQAFYTALGQGQTFGVAVQSARLAARKTSATSNTWAAYQCYGDVNWRLMEQTQTGAPSGAQSAFNLTPILPAVTVDELALQLEHIASEAEDASPATRAALRNALQVIDTPGEEPYQSWLTKGALAQALAKAWQSLGETQKAIDWYARAVNASDGSASFQAREQQLNLLVRRSDASLDEINKALIDFKALITMAPTAERWNLLGSAHKRVLMRGAESPSKDGTSLNEEQQKEQQKYHLREMRDAYDQARQLNPVNAFYPAAQHLLACLRLHWIGDAEPLPAAAEVNHIRELARQAETRDGADFWSTVAMPEYDLTEALLRNELPARAASIGQRFARIHQQVTNPSLWQSVHDTARFILVKRPGTAFNASNQAVQQLLGQLKAYANGSAW